MKQCTLCITHEYGAGKAGRIGPVVKGRLRLSDPGLKVNRHVVLARGTKQTIPPWMFQGLNLGGNTGGFSKH